MKPTSRTMTHLCAWLTILLTLITPLVMMPRFAFAASNLQSHAEQTVLVQFDANATIETRDTLIAEMSGELVTWMHQIHVAEILLPAGAVVASLFALANETV